MKKYEIEKGKIDISFIAYATEVDTHTHSGMEIVYILEGEAIQSINDAQVRTVKGNIVLMDRDCSHNFEIIRPLKYVNILFDCVENIPFDKSYISANTDEISHNLIFDMLEESELKQAGYEHIMKGKLEILIGRILRMKQPP